jgi:uncharacterized protein
MEKDKAKVDRALELFAGAQAKAAPDSVYGRRLALMDDFLKSLRRKSGQLEVRGDLHTRVALPCGRCLKEVELPVDVEFAERFAARVEWRHEEQHELSREELDLGIIDEAIDLNDLVKEEILLALPGHVLCSENCKGICPSCGANRNLADCVSQNPEVDARREKLRDLKF